MTQDIGIPEGVQSQIADLLDTTPDSPNRATALRLAADGYRTFPCDPATKRPLVKWRDRASDDPAQVRKWWRKWPNAMPGLPTGEANGVSVIDLDVGGGKDGLAAARAAGIDPDGADLIVATAGGGRHLYFAHSSGVTNSATREGLDVRGEGGYVIAPGAVGKAGRYRAVTGSLTAAALVGLSPFPAALLRPRAAQNGEASEPGTADLGDLKAALHHVPNNGSHDEWVRTLMALHHGTGGSSNGLALALGWSAGYPGFSHAEVREKWRSFRRGENPVTAETLFAQARQHGWGGIEADDFDDLDEDEPGTADLLDTSPEPRAKAGPLTFLSPAECAASNPRPYLVKGLLAERDVGCLVGAPGVGKSVLAPALAYAVAQGRETHGRRVKAGGVFYVAAEDEHGMRGRVTALRSEHGDADAFTLVGGVTDLLTEDVRGKGSRDFQMLRRAVKERRPSLVVIDTLALAFPGLEENSAEGMGRVVAVTRALTKWGAAVLLIHHDTKDGAQGLPRGHSLLNGALDLSIHLTKGQDGTVRGRLTKNRNGPCDVDLAFRIHGLPIGEDEDGDPMTAAVCEEVDPTTSRTAARLKPTEAAALDSIVEMIGDGESVGETDWRAAAREDARITTAEKSDSRRRVVAEALRGLARQNVVRVSDGQIRLIHIGGDPDFDDLPEEAET